MVSAEICELLPEDLGRCCVIKGHVWFIGHDPAIRSFGAQTQFRFYRDLTLASFAESCVPTVSNAANVVRRVGFPSALKER